MTTMWLGSSAEQSTRFSKAAFPNRTSTEPLLPGYEPDDARERTKLFDHLPVKREG